jgi:hypothetical protein
VTTAANNNNNNNINNNGNNNGLLQTVADIAIVKPFTFLTKPLR